MEIMVAIAILVGLGLAFGAILATANKVFYVEEDPRIDKVESMLPGSNCGACGFPGCRGFAENIVSGEANPSLCTVNSEEMILAIADYLGIQAGTRESKAARLLCAGGRREAPMRLGYEGLQSCRAAAIVGGGHKTCRFGCLGLGDCKIACQFDAITMNANGLPVVDPDKCTACGDCVSVCPKNLFIILPTDQKLLVQCRSLLKDEDALNTCSKACTGCGLCASDAAPGLIKMERNLPQIQEDKIYSQSPSATRRCPTGAITWVEHRQFTAAKSHPLPLGRVEPTCYQEDQSEA